MEVNKLVDLNNLRTAPKLSYGQEKKLLEELEENILNTDWITCLLYTSPSPRDMWTSRMPSSA